MGPSVGINVTTKTKMELTILKNAIIMIIKTNNMMKIIMKIEMQNR